MNLNRLPESKKYSKILDVISKLNPSIPVLTLLIRKLSGIIAFKSALSDSLVIKELERLKKPRTLDEFLASLTSEKREKE